MHSRVLASSMAALTLAVSPVVVQAAPVERAAAPAAEENDLRGGFIIPLVAIIAIILGVLLISNNGNHEPTSP